MQPDVGTPWRTVYCTAPPRAPNIAPEGGVLTDKEQPIYFCLLFQRQPDARTL